MSFSEDILDLQAINSKNQNSHSDISVVKNNSSKAQKSSRRWLVLLFFSLIIILNLYNLNEYFYIEDSFQTFYNKTFTSDDLKKSDLNYWQQLFNLLLHFLFLLPAMFLVQVKGIWFSCMIGIMLTTFGCWVKSASIKPEHFFFLPR